MNALVIIARDGKWKCPGASIDEVIATVALWRSWGLDVWPRVERGSTAGGHARASKLSPARRSEIARKAAAVRWAKSDASEADVDALLDLIVGAVPSPELVEAADAAKRAQRLKIVRSKANSETKRQPESKK